jgi:hypothetical protein
LEEGIIAEADPRDDMGSTECDLFNFWEKFFWGTIQDQLADFFKRNEFFWPNFGCVKNVKFEVMFLRGRNSLNAELPLGENSIFYGFIQVFTMEVWPVVRPYRGNNTLHVEKLTRILAGNLESFIPNQAMNSEFGNPMEFHEELFSFGRI